MKNGSSVVFGVVCFNRIDKILSLEVDRSKSVFVMHLLNSGEVSFFVGTFSCDTLFWYLGDYGCIF